MIRKFAEQLVIQASRPFPNRISVWNGVAVRDVPFFHPHDFRPMHKTELWKALRSVIDGGESVTFVGGGRGVVPVKAVEYGCDVTVIEAAAEMVELLEETATLNRTPMRIIHGLVEAGHNVYGDASEAKQLRTEDLAGDILVLDCEGAERDILPASQFDRIIVETHPQDGTPTELVRELLGGRVTHFDTARHRGDFLISDTR